MQYQPAVNDPWASAETPQVRQAEYFGQVKMDMFYAVLVKGVGKVPFDASTHSPDKRVTAIDIKILPLPEMNVNYEVSRSLIAESREWAGITLASIRALGLTVVEMVDKFVQVRYKPTGRLYKNTAGEEKEFSTFEFLRVFNSQVECLAAYQAGGIVLVAEDPNGRGPGAHPTAASAASPERDIALKFLRVVVESACRGQSDLGVISRTIAANVAGMPLINKFFTSDSPETLEMIMGAMAHA